MEHTYMGDLVLQVICPNGQTTLFHQQGGGGTYLGCAERLRQRRSTPSSASAGNYCWSPTATNGTWVENTANTTPSRHAPLRIHRSRNLRDRSSRSATSSAVRFNGDMDLPEHGPVGR
jgi:hypothetical protein